MNPKNFFNIFLSKAIISLMVIGLLLLPHMPAYGQVTIVQAPLPGATGEQRVIVILVNFLDKTSQPFSAASANDVVFNQTDAYYAEASYQKTWLSGAVVGWYTLPITLGTSCPEDQIFSEAVKAADPNVNFNNYDRIMIMFPRLTGCNWGGLGTLGKSTVTTNDGTVSASKAWINSKLPDLKVVGHEFGHNLGLSHATSWDCGAKIVTSDNGDCNIDEYGDFMDIMGVGSTGHINASFKNKLGWFDAVNVVTLQTSQDTGTYTVEPLENFSTGVQLIRILRWVDYLNQPHYYNIEYRQPISQDSFLSSYANIINGASIRWDVDTNYSYADRTHLLDMTPNSSQYTNEDFYDSSLKMGTAFMDPVGIEITPTAIGNSSITLNIHIPQSLKVVVTDPQDGAVLRGVYNLTAGIIPDRTVNAIYFYANDVWLGMDMDSASPYSLAWDTANEVDGVHLLTAVAEDLSGRHISPVVNIRVDNTPPEVAITSPDNGNTVSGQVQVTITAADATSGIKNVFFLVDGIIVDFYDQTVTSPYIFMWDTTNESEGEHTITAYATDLAGNRSNNQDIVVTLTTVLNQPPVLTVIGDKTVNEGNNLTFTVSATDPDGDALTYSATGLPAGAAFTGQTFNWTPGFTQCGSYQVTFSVSDGSLSTGETITITVVTDVPMPDLITNSLSTTATAVTRGSNFTLSNTVTNQGTASAGSFKIAFSLSTDAVYGGTNDIAFSVTRSVTGLAAGANSSASTTLTVPSTTPLGSYYVCAKADSDSTVTESDETNNSRCTTSTIQIALPDLVITQISGPASATTGTSVTLVNTVMNQGVSSASSFYVGFYLSADAVITTVDTQIGERNISGLAAGATNSGITSVTIPATLAAGTYYVGAIADHSNTIGETNETNNAAPGSTIVLTIGVDLVMRAVSGPASATRGTSISLVDKVKNRGVGKSGSFYVGFYLSTDATITTADTRISQRSITNLAAGITSSATTNVTIPTTFPVGTYYIGAIADYTNAVKENKETNNARAGNTINIQ